MQSIPKFPSPYPTPPPSPISVVRPALTLPLACRETGSGSSMPTTTNGATIDSGRFSTSAARTTGGSGGTVRRRAGVGMGVPIGKKKEASSSSSVERQLSSSFPRSSRLGGASASNGFASAWARGQRRRGDSLDGEFELRVLTVCVCVC